MEIDLVAYCGNTTEGQYLNTLTCTTGRTDVTALPRRSQEAVCWFWGSILALVTSALSGVVPVIGLICLPLACIFGLLPLAALIYGTIGGIQINQGQDFKYWLVGDFVQKNFMK